MDKIKIRKFVLDKTTKYKVPCIITLSGLPGSGKTTCAKVLSKNLKIFIVSNDFIRILCGNSRENLDKISKKRLNRKVLLLNIRRLLKLFYNRVSVVLDSDANDISKFKKIELLTKIFKYQIIKIKINSNDDKENISRIKNRKNDNNILDSEIIGDNIKPYSFDKQTYYRVKLRKPQLLEDNFFDYILDNNGNLDDYLNNLDKLVEDIQKKLVINRSKVNE